MLVSTYIIFHTKSCAPLVILFFGYFFIMRILSAEYFHWDSNSATQLVNKSDVISSRLSINMKKKKSILSWKIFLIENECRTPKGCLTFIFYQKYFYDKMDFRLFYFHVTINKHEYGNGKILGKKLISFDSLPRTFSKTYKKAIFLLMNVP